MLQWWFRYDCLIGETDQVAGIFSMILMVPSFNLLVVESENIVGARPSAEAS